jgi:hypothetical protein
LGLFVSGNTGIGATISSIMLHYWRISFSFSTTLVLGMVFLTNKVHSVEEIEENEVGKIRELTWGEQCP